MRTVIRFRKFRDIPPVTLTNYPDRTWQIFAKVCQQQEVVNVPAV